MATTLTLFLGVWPKAYLLQVGDSRCYVFRNGELRQLLGITEALDMELLPVRITSRDPSNFTWEAGVDAGTDDGVRVGMPVVANADGAGALAGTVASVTEDTARIRFIVDTRSAVIALV